MLRLKCFNTQLPRCHRLVFGFLLLASSFFIPATAGAEYIEEFQSDIEVREDASVTVTESIRYTFDEGPRHGIFREIPLAHPQEASVNWKNRVIDIDLTSVTMDGESVPYVIESTKDRFKVRIGDPNATIDGTHTYDIGYTVTGGLWYSPTDGTELYFNVTGNEWQVPIRSVSATVHDPDGLFKTARSCYSGVLGSTSGSCTMEASADGGVVFKATNLAPYEGMTFAQSLNPTKTAVVVTEVVRVWLFAIPLFVLGLFYGAWRLYRYKTEHKTGRTIIPEYEPYAGMRPMYTGFLMDGRLDPRDITACIVTLAQEGFITIKKTERKVLFLFEVDDYEVSLVKLPDETLSVFEKDVFGLIFKGPLTVGSVVSLADLKSDMSERKANYAEFVSLESTLRDDLREKGFREVMGWGSIAQTVGYVLIAWSVFYTILAGGINGGLFITGIFILIFLSIFLYERKTRLAYEVTDYLKGFKLFLETTERDRYLFHNAPEKSPEQFMEYLPYAIAFGVEEKWAEVFKDIALPSPGWYDGGNVSTFNAVSLSHSLGAFSTAFASSSGASPSSGGGSSGGGSGGGGGGSW